MEFKSISRCFTPLYVYLCTINRQQEAGRLFRRWNALLNAGKRKMELTMKQSLALSSLLLTAGLVSTTAQSAEFASADCVTGLNEIGLISVSNICGNPQDVERIVALKADEQGASWYRIVQMYEEQQPDNWRVQAILYA